MKVCLKSLIPPFVKGGEGGLKRLLGQPLRILCLLFVFFGVWPPSAHAELSDAVVQHTFHPYASGKPTVDGLAPGTDGVPRILGSGGRVSPRGDSCSCKVRRALFHHTRNDRLAGQRGVYQRDEATRRARKDRRDGELEGYVAGLPFPVLDPADAQAGLKAAWNMRYRDFGDTVQAWNTFRIQPESGAAEREIENYYVIAYGMHRPVTDGANPNKWEKDGVLYKELFHITSPFDLKNTISLKHRYVRDQANDDNWMYTPAARKIRKMIVKHDEALYDSGYLNEDGFGYWGYLRSYTWKFLGARRLLAPTGVKAVSATYGGRGNWYPTDPWELRDMLVLEGVPQASAHPYSKRVLYIDQQMFAPLYGLFYDQQGKHDKTLFELYGNPKHNPGNEHVRVPLWVGETMIGHQDNLAAITTFTKVVYNAPLPDDFFHLDKIAARGQ